MNMELLGDLFHSDDMGISSNWNKIEILIMFWRAKFDQMLLVVTLESVESSQCVIGLLHKKLWSGRLKEDTDLLKKILKN